MIHTRFYNDAPLRYVYFKCYSCLMLLDGFAKWVLLNKYDFYVESSRTVNF